MDFTWTEEQRMMAGAFRALLDGHCSPADLRVATDTQDDSASKHGESAVRWQRIVEMGLPGVLAPESAGGMGLADIDLVLIAEEAGRAALPESLIDHAGVAVPLLAEFAGNARAVQWLARAATGEARVAVGPACNPFVLGASQADALLLSSEDEVHLVERHAVELTAQSSIDPLRSLSRVSWTPSAATCIAGGAEGRTAWARAFERGALLTAAQCAGLTERMVQLSVDYAGERLQFGRPIGSYQALKHHLANVRVKLEFARPLIYSAATRLGDLDDHAAAAISSAKLAAGDAAELGARVALQVHGAMGYSWEMDLHFYMKRAWALIGAWGDRNFHARRMQSAVLGGHVALGPGQTFVRGGPVTS